MIRPSLMCLFAAAAAVAPACDRVELAGPPTIRLGRDECVACGMLVSEERCSCTLLVDTGGRREHLIFDDLGCLLDHRADKPDVGVIATFVRDYPTGRWLDGESARYLVADSLATPMGSGMAAFETDATAQAAAPGGQIVDYSRLVETRRAWREARRGGRPRPASDQTPAP